MTEKQIAAHHEAGHAVTRIALGLSFRWVSVGQRDDGSLGRVSGAPHGLKRLNSLVAQQEELPPELVALAERCIVSTLAGPYAEMIAGRGRLLSLYSGVDDLDVVSYLCDAIGIGGDEIRERLAPNARRLLDTFWPAVERVAEALTERSPGSLSYRQVTDVASRSLT